jgi:hypothetical protein
MSIGEFHVQQYFDANAVGVRWLNLSGLRAQLAADAEVIIRTHAVTLEAERATVRLFDNHLDLQQRILVIAPHPDDAEIAAFGLYADRQASVVTVTAGHAGDMNYRANVSDPAQHYALKGYLRAVDSVTVPWQGNVPPERTANLGYFDGRLDAMYLAPEQTLPEVYGANTGSNLGRLDPDICKAYANQQGGRRICDEARAAWKAQSGNVEGGGEVDIQYRLQARVHISQWGESGRAASARVAVPGRGQGSPDSQARGRVAPFPDQAGLGIVLRDERRRNRRLSGEPRRFLSAAA